MQVKLIKAEDGEQILVLPPGLEFEGPEVLIQQDGDRLIISPALEEAAS
jgi:virulence-associated protein VagC